MERLFLFLETTATGAANGLFLLDAAQFVFRNKPALFADCTENATAGNGLAESAVQLLGRFTRAQGNLRQNSHLLSDLTSISFKNKKLACILLWAQPGFTRVENLCVFDC